MQLMQNLLHLNHAWANKGTANMRRFYLDKPNAKVMGVCAGVAACTGWDALWVRLGSIAAVLMGFGLLVPIYVLVALVSNAKTRHEDVEVFAKPRDISGYRGRFADIQAELRNLEGRFGR
jgi:phage shock protein PspC (stress-responsive transcriptional regulator)